MVSTRLMRIFLEGLTPKLRVLKFWISFLHNDDGSKMESKVGRERFWHRRYQGVQHDSKMMDFTRTLSKEDHQDGLELVETYELNELSINRPWRGKNMRYLEQKGALRSLVPYLRRCRQLERLELLKFTEGGVGLWELTATLYYFCPRLNACETIWSYSSYPRSIPDQLFEQVLLASQRGWKDVDLGSTGSLSRASIRAFMGTARGKEIATGRRQAPLQWTSYSPSATEIRLAGLQDQDQTKDTATILYGATATTYNSRPPQKESTPLGDMQGIAILPRLQILETLKIAGCTAITSHNIQTILCSCPVLRKFVALTGDQVATTKGPFLMVQDMRRPVVAFDCVMSGRDTDGDMSRNGSELELNEEEEEENHQQQNGHVWGWRSCA